jgi:hypothetical protein
LVFGLWFLNEGAASLISMSIKEDEYLYIISGVLMILISLFFRTYFCIDPIDAGLIIHEQAINLTSQYTNRVREEVTTQTFFNEVRAQDKNVHLYCRQTTTKKATQGKSLKDASQILLQQMGEEHILKVEEYEILRRWQSPSIIEALCYPNALRLLVFCSALFFKYRVVNKRMQLYAVQIDFLAGDLLNITFLLASETIQILFGFLITRYFNGRRLKLNFYLLSICVPLEIV